MTKAKKATEKNQNQENMPSNAVQTNGQNSLSSPSGNTEQTGLARQDSFVPSVFTGSPLAMMRRFREEMDRLFEDFGFGRGLLPGFGRDLFSRALGDFTESAWSPQVEMFEREGKLIIRADLPGMSKDKVKVEVHDNSLTISGERRQENEEKREGYYHSERSYGSFFRQLPLPQGVNADDATATFNDGVLEITMQALEKQKRGRQIEIKNPGENTKQS